MFEEITLVTKYSDFLIIYLSMFELMYIHHSCGTFFYIWSLYRAFTLNHVKIDKSVSFRAYQ